MCNRWAWNCMQTCSFQWIFSDRWVFMSRQVSSRSVLTDIHMSWRPFIQYRGLMPDNGCRGRHYGHNLVTLHRKIFCTLQAIFSVGPYIVHDSKLDAVTGIEAIPEAEFRMGRTQVKASLTRQGVELFATSADCIPCVGTSDLGLCKPISDKDTPFWATLNKAVAPGSAANRPIGGKLELKAPCTSNWYKHAFFFTGCCYLHCKLIDIWHWKSVCSILCGDIISWNRDCQPMLHWCGVPLYLKTAMIKFSGIPPLKNVCIACLCMASQ